MIPNIASSLYQYIRGGLPITLPSRRNNVWNLSTILRFSATVSTLALVPLNGGLSPPSISPQRQTTFIHIGYLFNGGLSPPVVDDWQPFLLISLLNIIRFHSISVKKKIISNLFIITISASVIFSENNFNLLKIIFSVFGHW
jgi:hypothetical protein